MTLRVVGAGLGRTGTTSLKAALEFLLKAPCYHMDEVYNHPEHVEVWRSALRGDSADLSALMEGYAASVDWPAGAFWRELSSLFRKRPANPAWRGTGGSDMIGCRRRE